MGAHFASTNVLAAGAEPLLVAVIGLLALVIVGLVAMAVVLRRRTRNQLAQRNEPQLPTMPAAPPAVPRPRARPQMVRGGGGGGLAVATSSAMVCPTCRTEYHGMTYCTRDARRLVPPEDMLAGPGIGPLRSAKSAGLVCMACRRAYEPGLRSCRRQRARPVPGLQRDPAAPPAWHHRAGRRDRPDLSGVRDEVRSQRAVLRPRRRRAGRHQLIQSAGPRGGRASFLSAALRRG